MKQRENNIFIISAPSGAGKSTLIHLLIAEVPSLCFSVSHTTRPPREGEKEGVEYYFVDETRFKSMIQNDEFLEWAQVHGYFYGTSRQVVHRCEQQEKDLLLDIDIQGAAMVRRALPKALSIFILPPSLEVLRERLLRRQKDTLDQIENRLENARNEIRHYKEYDYIIINQELASAFENLVSVIRGQKCKREHLGREIEAVLESFGIA